MQERLGELGDLGRHGGREEQRLPGERHEFADLLDIGNEPHVEHTVGFVDDQDLDPGQEKLAAFGEVEEAARRGDEHVRAAHDLGFLVAERDAADQQGHVDLVIDAVASERLLDLGREFAGRLKDEGSWHPGASPSAFEAGQHRKRESRRLAGPGLGDAEDVAPRERDRNGLFLDRGRRVVAGRFYGLQNLVAQAEFVEIH